MHFSLKEENYVVIENGSYRIKAIKGVGDTNRFPSVVGHKTEDNENQNSEVQTETVSSPDVSAPNSPNSSTPPKRNSKEPKYICGAQLEEFKEGDLRITSPIKRGVIQNWEELEALWRHILLKELNIKRARNECPVLVSVPNSWTRDNYERITQLFFERFNAPGLYIANQALMTMYGFGSLTGLVVDVGHGKTEVTPVIDCSIQYHASQTLPLAGQDFDEYFLSLLLSDKKFMEEYGDTPDLEFARAIKETDICEIPEDPHQVEDEKLERMEAYEPLFNPQIINRHGTLSLPEAINLAISLCESDKRSILWESIVLTGGSSLIKGFKERLEAELRLYLAASENYGDFQMKEVKFLKLPEYFTNLRERPDLAGFLGSSITAKASSTKSTITSTDQASSIPKAINLPRFN
ncbi:14051_t:CDS:2, partial [Acaulospora colombiana]